MLDENAQEMNSLEVPNKKGNDREDKIKYC